MDEATPENYRSRRERTKYDGQPQEVNWDEVGRRRDDTMARHRAREEQRQKNREPGFVRSLLNYARDLYRSYTKRK